MEPSTGFAHLEEMIEQHREAMNICDFAHLLKQLEEDEHITTAEHESLLIRMAGQ